EEGLHQCINQHYRLYLMAAKISLDELPEPSAQVRALDMSRGELDSELCKWFNQTVSGTDRPWVIRSSDFNSIDEKNHEILVSTHLNEDEARAEIIKRLARTRWQASGLSLQPDASDDILTQALYRYWQQRWFAREFGPMGVEVNSVFPLAKEEAQALKLSASQPYLQEADRQIELWNGRDVQLWPAFWYQMSGLVNHRVEGSIEGSINEASVVGGDNAPEPYNPEVEEKEAPAIDQRTNYECFDRPELYDFRIFDTQDYSCVMYRWWAKDIFVSEKGAVKEIALNDKDIYGVETLTPARLPGRDQPVSLASDQTLATFDWTSGSGRYALPSLTPDDYIVALRIEPDVPYTLVRNQYTGLHTLSVAVAETKQKIQFAYVVEHRGACRKTRTRGVRSAQSTRFDARCSQGMKTVLKEVFENINRQPLKVREPLRTIQKAKNMKQRIVAIKDYCKQFSGNAIPERHKNFFRFLVTQRQGSCRHRVSVFVALCRYFGIPSRKISNINHSFAEYSVDGGQTWDAADLGGAPADVIEIKSDFQLTGKVSLSSSDSKKVKDVLKSVLKGADSAQQQTLAKACGIALEELSTALETNSALPETNLNISETVENLWKERDLAGFSMGVSLLESLQTEVLGDCEKRLVCAEGEDWRAGWRACTPMADAVGNILFKSNEDQITEQLKLLHSKMVVKGGVSPLQWLDSIMDVLRFARFAIFAKSSEIHFAREALKSGWLNPVPTYDSRTIKVIEYLDRLQCLENVDELKVTVAGCLKKWYQELFFSERSSQVWRETYKKFQKREGDTLFVTDCHGGFSSFLENIIASTSLQPVWTDHPEGVPDIERMLVHQPAFAQLISGKANHRPVIIMGQPAWKDTVFDEMANVLFQRKVETIPNLKRSMEKARRYSEILAQINSELKAAHSSTLGQNGYHYRSQHQRHNQDFSSAGRYQDAREEYEKKELEIRNRYKPTLESLETPQKDAFSKDHLRTKCKQAIRQAFSHYLYEVTHSKNGRLTYCWADASIRGNGSDKNYGAHDPSSPAELYAMMSEIRSPSQFPGALKEAYLRQAYKAGNALFLKSDELTTIAREFLDSLNLNSIYHSLDA
ncbi:transglutaminase-like domain-containing protein, partial [Endozoicomonas sp. ONNA1]